MVKIVEPKEWKHPRMYLSLNKENELFELQAGGIIIIYPDRRKRSERNGNGVLSHWFSMPCWETDAPFEHPDKKRKRMFEYCEKQGIKRIFVGEIR